MIDLEALSNIFTPEVMEAIVGALGLATGSVAISRVFKNTGITKDVSDNKVTVARELLTTRRGNQVPSVVVRGEGTKGVKHLMKSNGWYWWNNYKAWGIKENEISIEEAKSQMRSFGLQLVDEGGRSKENTTTKFQSQGNSIKPIFTFDKNCSGVGCDLDSSWRDRNDNLVELHNWQKEALGAWADADYQGVVQAITGTGKTHIGIAAIRHFVIYHKFKAVILVPTVILQEQWIKTLKENLSVHVSGYRKEKPLVLVETIQTNYRSPAVTSNEKVLLIADEVHRYGSPVWSKALREERVYRLGLTATLDRGDEGDDILSDYFGNKPCFELGYDRAVADHLISPYRIAFCLVKLNRNEQDNYDKLTSVINRNGRILENITGISMGDSVFIKTINEIEPYNNGYEERCKYLSSMSKRRELLASSQAKLDALSYLSETCKKSKVLIFTETKQASNLALQALIKLGCEGYALHSDVKKPDRELYIESFRKGESQILSSPKILDEGVDFCQANLGIVMSANKTRRQMIQRLGRVLRKDEDKVANFIIMGASGTIEDYHHDKSGDFYSMCVPYALEYGSFDMSFSDQIIGLRKFMQTK